MIIKLRKGDRVITSQYSRKTDSHEVKYEERGDYLYAYISGNTNTLEVSKKAWGAIAQECKKKEFTKVLIEEEVEKPMTVFEVYQLISDLPSYSFTTLTVAFVDKATSHDELNRFAELVGINRGLNGRFFNEPSLAENWLRSQ